MGRDAGGAGLLRPYVPSARAVPALSTTRTRTFSSLAARSAAVGSGITAKAVARASASVAVGAITDTLRCR